MERSQLGVGQERPQMSDKMWRLGDVFCVFPSVCFATSPLRAVPGHRFFGLPREPPPGAAAGWPTGTVGSQVVVKSGYSPRAP